MVAFKDAFKALTTVSLSVFLSTLVARSIFNFQFIELWAIVILFILFAAFLVLSLRSDWVEEKLWTRNSKKKFESALIGIVYEEQCENTPNGHPATSFLANDWKVKLTQLGLKAETISIEKLEDKYAVIINPYGEVYPERDPISMGSLENIKKYIRRGGIFVCAGGVPFYYCWDSRTHQQITLAKILQAYVQIGQNAQGQSILLPTFFYPPPYSLMDNPLNEHFGVSVIGDIQRPQNAPNGWLPIYPTTQANEDIQYVGDLTQVGGTNQVYVFRAVLPITRCCIPFLRANIPTFGEVYPIAGIPYERGLLVVCGMDFITNAAVGNLVTSRVGFEKICEVVKNVLNGVKIGTVSYDWRKRR